MTKLKFDALRHVVTQKILKQDFSKIPINFMRQKANFIHVCLLILDGKFFQVQTGSYFGGNIGSSFAEAIKG